MGVSANHFMAVTDGSLVDDRRPTAYDAGRGTSQSVGESGHASSFIMYFSFIGVGSLIGMWVSPGYALVDTGAQHGVIGLNNYHLLVTMLKQNWGLAPRVIDTLQMTAKGVGGETSFLLSAQVPVGVGGTSGVLTIHVVEDEMPLLLPVDFCKRLGMVLDLPKGEIFWKSIGK